MGKDKERAYYEGVFKQRVEEGWDRFTVCWRIGEHPDILVVVPHGGKIEPRTSEIGERIAQRLGASLYIFKASEKEKDLKLRETWCTGGHPFHITSTCLRAPHLMEMLKDAVCIAVHGMAEESECTAVGGLNSELQQAIIGKLKDARKANGELAHL
jgi:phage replication-related protein YjqB (UPF0714/DUF867 family)